MKARSLTAGELRQIRSHLETASPRDRALFEIGVNCGLRISEIVSLNVGDVWAYDSPASRLELTRTKGGKPRAVPLNGRAKDAISALVAAKADVGERLDPDASLFTNKDGHRLTRYGADHALKSVFKACRLSGKVTTHSLRKTFATRLLDKNANLRVIQTLLGHSSLQTTERYLSITERQMQDAVEGL